MSKWKKAKERLLAGSENYSPGELSEFLSSIGYSVMDDEDLSKDYISLYSKFENKIIVMPSESPIPKPIVEAVIKAFRENGDL